AGANFDFEGFDFSNLGGSSFSDIFSDLFGSFRGGSAGTTGGSGRRSQRGGARTAEPQTPIRGEDILYPINIGFMDSVRGISTEITINRSVPCTVCSGKGTDPSSSPKICQECKGSGQVDRSRGYMKFSSLCPV